MQEHPEHTLEDLRFIQKSQGGKMLVCLASLFDKHMHIR